MITSPLEVARQLLELDDDRYFAAGEDHSERELALLELDFHGPAVGAPSEADPAAGPVPLLVALRQDALRNYEVSWAESRALVCFDWERGAVEVGHLRSSDEIDWPTEATTEPHPRPEGDDATAIMSVIERFDARRSLRLAASSGTKRFWVLHYDRPSNPVDVTVLGEVAVPARAATVYPRPGAPHPTYLGAPSGESATLRLVADGDARIRADGSLSVTATERHRIDAPLTLEEADGTDRSVVALVDAAFLILHAGSRVPWLKVCRFPVYGVAPVALGATLEPCFDLTLEGAGLAVRSDSIGYLMADGHLHGPFPVTTPA